MKKLIEKLKSLFKSKVEEGIQEAEQKIKPKEIKIGKSKKKTRGLNPKKKKK